MRHRKLNSRGDFPSIRAVLFQKSGNHQLESLFVGSSEQISDVLTYNSDDRGLRDLILLSCCYKIEPDAVDISLCRIYLIVLFANILSS